MPWDGNLQLPMLFPVQTVGYPYGLVRDEGLVMMRAFSGEVVSGRIWDGLSSKPRVYELSFQSPRGLSGAALLTNGTPEPLVAGVMIGNQITEMTVYSERETEVVSGKESVFQKVEALHLGIAVQGATLRSIDFSLLGCTLGEWLKRHKLIF